MIQLKKKRKENQKNHIFVEKNKKNSIINFEKYIQKVYKLNLWENKSEKKVGVEFTLLFSQSVINKTTVSGHFFFTIFSKKKYIFQKQITFQSNNKYTKNYLGQFKKTLFIKGHHSSTFFFLLGSRKPFFLINSQKSVSYLTSALHLLSLMLQKKKHLLIVNTNSEVSLFVENIVKQNSKYKKVSYYNSKWVGGTLTNWNQIYKSIHAFVNFYKKYDNSITTNKIYFPRYKKMKKSFRGFICIKQKTISITSNKKPDVLFVCNPNDNQIVINEANRLDIPVIALTDSNSRVAGINYPIPANSNSVEFLFFSLKWVIRILQKI